MDPITITLLLLLGGAATAVSLAAVEEWIAAHRVPGGTAQILRSRLADGKFRVVTGVFDANGLQVASRTWQAKRLDAELEARFAREGEVIRVVT